MNTFRHKFIDAVRTNTWNAIQPGMEQKVVCTVGTVTALGSSVYLGYSTGNNNLLGTMASVGLSVGAGFLAAFAAYVPIVAISGLPLFTAVGAGRMLKDFQEDHAHIHIGK